MGVGWVKNYRFVGRAYGQVYPDDTLSHDHLLFCLKSNLIQGSGIEAAMAQFR
jgi:hypothetical protein